MENEKWSIEDFKMYMLIYCMNANFIESQDEIDLIKSKFKEGAYKRIHKEFEKDNDFQSIEKLQKAFEDLGLEKNDVEMLFDEVKEVFLSDGKFDQAEQGILLGLKHLFH
jgi:hypothetical protein